VPELPEVETFRADLERVLVGRTFTGAHADWPRQLPRNEPRELDERIRGQRVERIGRHGKILHLDLTHDALLIHLKMSGRLLIVRAREPADKHAHVVFGLDGGDELRFHDPRKFGRVWLLSDPIAVLGALGPDALDPELTAGAFKARIRARRGRLKPLLLDQTFVAGIGNIYADEALWLARLHPLRAAGGLSDREIGRLYRAIRSVLETGVLARGATITTGGYRDLGGAEGGMAAQLKVFRRTGLACPRCGSKVARTVVGARSTHFCPRCQGL
jgi:formamidopyrimidine-DNA glycosylase